jgi:aspartate racemase
LASETLHAIRECAELLKAAGFGRAGIAATEGTVESGIFQTVLNEYGISSCAPGEAGQGKVNSLIYDCVKKGITPDVDMFYDVKNELMKDGAEAVILGCTELSLIKRDFNTGERCSRRHGGSCESVRPRLRKTAPEDYRRLI